MIYYVLFSLLYFEWYIFFYSKYNALFFDSLSLSVSLSLSLSLSLFLSDFFFIIGRMFNWFEKHNVYEL